MRKGSGLRIRQQILPGFLRRTVSDLHTHFYDQLCCLTRSTSYTMSLANPRGWIRRLKTEGVNWKLGAPTASVLAGFDGACNSGFGDHSAGRPEMLPDVALVTRPPSFSSGVLVAAILQGENAVVGFRAATCTPNLALQRSSASKRPLLTRSEYPNAA